MRVLRLSSFVVFFFSLAALACALPKLPLPALTKATPTAAATALATPPAAAREDYRLENGLTLGSLETSQQILANQSPLLESLAKERYTPEELSQAGKTYTYTIKLGKEQPLIWQTNWCTTTEAILQQNLERLRVEFVVNGEVIDPNRIGVVQVESQVGEQLMHCAYYIASVYNWPTGKTLLEIRVTFTEPINDGIGDYPAGAHIYRYEVDFYGIPTLEPPDSGGGQG